MDEFVNWLTDEGSLSGQLRHRHVKPERAAEFVDIDLNDRVEHALDARGIERLYRHQADGIGAVRDGDNVVVSTPTASGKSLIYTVPAVESALESGRRTLYVAPLLALINDQEAALSAFVDKLGSGPQVRVAQYTGQQESEEKRRIRDREPHILLMTPDMLHEGLLPDAHRLWDWFFESLDTVVLDEIHAYRGVFGSHVSLVLRRLTRICERFDAAPRYVCCSATIGNPVEHASAVTGHPESSFVAIDEDTSAAGRRHWVFWNPLLKEVGETDGGTTGQNESPAAAEEARGNRRSPHPVTARLMAALIQRDNQVLAFTNTRQTAERYAKRTASLLSERGVHDSAESVTAYQAALQQDRREAIEDRLQNGSLRGLWSTNALELGIDIGSLDAVLLDTYPGTRMETHQRAGRAGRGTDPSLVALIAGSDQLDQYMMANPKTFFEEPPERAIVNPTNPELLPAHVHCAARDNWLSSADDKHFGEGFVEAVASLVDSGKLERRSTESGTRWTNKGDDKPQRELDLRTIDDREIELVDEARDRTIGGLPFSDALRDAHPGAIYHHQLRKYKVTDLDIDGATARLQETRASYHTRAIREKDLTVERELDDRSLEAFGELTVTLADITLCEQIDSYFRYHGPDEDRERVALDEPLPETTMRTRALFFTIPPPIERDLLFAADSEDEYRGALHAIEHGLISLFPLELLCDRRDIGGFSTPIHPHTGRSTVFIHDGHPGGVGLARGGFETLGSLLEETGERIAACQCAAGCPSCIQSPHCWNGNELLSKTLAVELFERLADSE